MSVVVVLVVF